MGCWDDLVPIEIRQFSRGPEKTIVTKILEVFFLERDKARHGELIA